MLNQDSGVVADAAAMKPRTSLRPGAYKIAVYGFGSQPVMYRHLIELAAKEKLPLTWCAILTAPHHRQVMREVLPADEILDEFRTLPRVPVGGDLACLAHYPGSLVEDLAAQKRRRRKRSGRWLLNRGIDYYKMYKTFLADRGATHLLMPLVETPEAKIALAAARELGLGVLVPYDMRNMTGTFFAPDCYETPPVYAAATPECRAQAAEFVDRFRQQPTPARALPAEIASQPDDVRLPGYTPPLWRRIVRQTAAAMERPDIFDHDEVRRAVMANSGLLRKVIRGFRERRNAVQYDIAEAAALPERFIFYPLQYTPESSINVPAPYFVEQTRVVDALRFAMPSDYVLVVKEHPVCLGMRPLDFLPRLRNLPGVMVIKASVPAIEVIKRAALTATVTGTAAFEAILLGRPAIAFGPGLSAWIIGRMAMMADLRAEMLRAISEPPSDDFVIGHVAKLMSVRYPFYFDTTGLPGEPMLRLNNMQGFLSALLKHFDRERASQTRGEPSVA
jgi:Capsule polysaccharide biosynthesis protein